MFLNEVKNEMFEICYGLSLLYLDCNLFLLFYFICNICKVYNNMYLLKSNGVISMEGASF